MREDDLNLALDLDPSQPLYVRICRSVARAIEKGTLKPGDMLPGSRVLAEHFNVNRNTVVLSLSLLEAQGWIEISPKRGAFVAHRDAESVKAGWEQRLVSAVSEGTPTPFNWTVTPEDSTSLLSEVGIDLSDGLPDARLFPAAELGRLYKKAMERKQGEALTTQDPKGHSELRKALAAWLARRRGFHRGFESLVTTTGLPMAIDLLVKATLWKPGVVALESPGSPEIRKILENKRVGILGLPVDEEGLKVVELKEHLEAGVPIRLLILSAACQYPTGRQLSGQRRQVLLELVRHHHLVIAEDDGAAVWYWDSPPPLPLAHFDHTGKIVHLASFARWLAPGIHSGFIYARGSVADRLAGLKKAGHLATDQVLESALASLLTRDALQIHLRQARRHYVSRLQRAAEILSTWPGFQVEPRGGGLGLWVRLPDGFDAHSWQHTCAQRNISLLLGSDFGEAAGEGRHVFLGLAQFDLLELEGVLAKLRSCWPTRAIGKN